MPHGRQTIAGSVFLVVPQRQLLSRPLWEAFSIPAFGNEELFHPLAMEALALEIDPRECVIPGRDTRDWETHISPPASRGSGVNHCPRPRSAANCPKIVWANAGNVGSCSSPRCAEPTLGPECAQALSTPGAFCPGSRSSCPLGGHPPHIATGGLECSQCVLRGAVTAQHMLPSDSFILKKKVQ